MTSFCVGLESDLIADFLTELPLSKKCFFAQFSMCCLKNVLWSSKIQVMYVSESVSEQDRTTSAPNSVFRYVGG